MIDLKTLTENEHEVMLTGDVDKMELTRLAMRYLALRQGGIYFSTCNPLSLRGENLDAHADRMIKEMLQER